MSMKIGGTDEFNSEINVTPMVDVMLVLLIIFMIVTPLLQQGVSVNLPRDMISPDPDEEIAKGFDRSVSFSKSQLARGHARLRNDLSPPATTGFGASLLE